MGFLCTKHCIEPIHLYTCLPNGKQLSIPFLPSLAIIGLVTGFLLVLNGIMGPEPIESRKQKLHNKRARYALGPEHLIPDSLGPQSHHSDLF